MGVSTRCWSLRVIRYAIITIVIIIVATDGVVDVNIHTYAHNLIRYASSEALSCGNSPTPRSAGSREGETSLGEGEMVVRCMPECPGMPDRSRWTLLGRGLSYRNSPERVGGVLEGRERGGRGREESKP